MALRSLLKSVPLMLTGSTLLLGALFGVTLSGGFVSSALAEDAAAAKKPAQSLSLGTLAPAGTPWAEALQKWGDLIKERSKGEIDVKIYLGGSIGDELEICTQVKRGQLQAGAVSLAPLGSQVPELEVLELPGMFWSYAEADAALDHPKVQEKVRGLLEARGLYPAFWSENGMRSFGTKFALVKSPDDLKGRKMRSLESQSHIAMWRAFGASPVVMPADQVLTSLETGAVDGFDQTPLFAGVSNWTRSVKYFTISNHIFSPALIALNKPFWDNLSQEQRDLILKISQEIGPDLRVEVRALSKLIEEALPDEGLEVHTLTDDERRKFFEVSKGAQQEFIKKQNKDAQDLYKLVQEALAEFKAKQKSE